MSSAADSEWMFDQQVAAAGVLVDWTRDGVVVAEALDAVVGRHRYASARDGGAQYQYGQRDYLIKASDLAEEGIAEPALGDRLTEVIGGVACVFEVTMPDNGEPAWRWSDEAHVIWRIHVKPIL